jgi:hypothetical protein
MNRLLRINQLINCQSSNLISTFSVFLDPQVLLELQSQGRSGLVDPDELYQLCLIAGLVTNPGTTSPQVRLNPFT